MYKKLVASELLKPGREGRGETIIRKIQDGDPFLLNNGSTVVIKKDLNLVNTIKKALESRDNKTLNSVEFKGADGKTYRLSDFAKSPEFGGKGAGSGTRAEDEALSDFRRKLQKVLDDEALPYIFVNIGKKTEKVSAVESTPGTPKSDFHLMDETGKEVFWISHKKGRRANDFQQYGGMVEIQDEAEVKQFVVDLKKNLENDHGDPNKFPMKVGYYRPVQSQSVIMKTLYGKDFKPSKADNRQNIDVLFQGPLVLKKIKSGKIPTYTITSNHTMVHGEKPTGDYACYYYVRPEQAKKQFGVQGGRFFIVAKATAVKNKNAKEI